MEREEVRRVEDTKEIRETIKENGIDRGIAVVVDEEGGCDIGLWAE